MPGIFICLSPHARYSPPMKTPPNPLPTDPSSPDPLLPINAKTSLFPPARSWSGGRKRILGPDSLPSNFYHVMSRTCGGDIFFDDTEKEALRRILHRLADFSGIHLLTFCVMGNHFHLLASVPHRPSWIARFDGPDGEQRLLSHLRTLYSKAYIDQLQAELTEWRRLGNETAVQKKLDSFKHRLCDLSRFVKEVKERFSRWYNKRHQRQGTLWMDRFKSVLIEANLGKKDQPESARIDVVRAMAAYIDLNPVRASLVQDPADYPWCGYSEAIAGKRNAQRGLCRIMQKPVDSWDTHQVAQTYATLLTSTPKSTTQKQKPTPKTPTKPNTKSSTEPTLQPHLDAGEKLTLPDLLHQRIRLFSEAIVLGSQAFVEEVFQTQRHKFGPKRKQGARPVPHSTTPLYSIKRVHRWDT
jgi:putative transposase